VRASTVGVLRVDARVLRMQVEVLLTRSSASGREGRAGGVDPEPSEDLACQPAARDERCDSAPGTAGALENVEREHPLEKRSPVQTARPEGHGRRSQREGVETELVAQSEGERLVVEALWGAVGRGLAAARASLGRLWDQQRAHVRAWSEHAEVPCGVDPRRGHDRGEAFEELGWLERDGLDAVGEGSAQREQDFAVRGSAQAIDREGRAQSVAKQMLEPFPVAFVNMRSGLE